MDLALLDILYKRNGTLRYLQLPLKSSAHIVLQQALTDLSFIEEWHPLSRMMTYMLPL